MRRVGEIRYQCSSLLDHAEGAEFGELLDQRFFTGVGYVNGKLVVRHGQAFLIRIF
jgi:hypothetical protein